MASEGDSGQAAVTQLRAYLAQSDLPADGRLPPERELCGILGVSRGDLRKGLAVLEAEGQLWRHVGKGTFVGARPADDVGDIAAIAGRTTPAEVMRTRLLIEPQIAREAAFHATADDIAAMRHCVARMRMAESWRHYERLDNELHRRVAEAARNTLLLALFDTLNAVRRTVVWGRLRDGPRQPPADHHSFAEHDAVIDAIAERDLDAAERAMRRHLGTVGRLLTGTPPGEG
ncbi:FadR family transcriptional regulator [Kaustia mangrovi]|uniref:FadR family transcriptional regulator n=1 Tax=Kaustia mangrovi TaxID=2593653 RepID=A0A7S8HCK4_9HYPH|nr:FCD domain-containing protein [Kaustia mangrovi]QPC43827.1 FadR family transcriptional regulator [Kaustia mangrovi]